MKYWIDKSFKLDNLATWKRYPVQISDKLVKMVIEKSKKKYNPKHVKYVLSLLFSEMAQDIKNSKTEQVWFFDNFGSFKTKIYDKLYCLNGQRKLKDNCKNVRFAFAYNYKATAYKLLNKEDNAVIDYLIEKRRNRVIAKRVFGINYEQNKET